MNARTYLGTELDARYRISHPVGEGASSWVFAARDIRLEREVAVKILKPEVAGEATGHRRLIDEGKTLACLLHPHIVAVYDAGQTRDGLVYLVMELSPSGTLADELARSGSLSVPQTLNLLLPLLGALACAHDRGIVHRDIKPANIALAREAGSARAKLLDFGIAMRGAPASSAAARGTPAYMSPEQSRGEPLGPETDVWSIGVLFFLCLTGKLPFEAESTTGLLNTINRERAPHLRDVLPSLPLYLSLALDQALEPDRRLRFQSMRELAQALALACCQDELSVSVQPEPLGLPDFGQWLANADLEATRDLPVSAMASNVERSAAGRRLPWLLGSVLGLSALALLALTLHGQPDGSPSARLRASTPLSAPVATAQVAAVPASAQPPISPALAPVRLDEPAPVPRAAAHKRLRRPGPSADAGIEASPLESARETAARRGFVTSWEW